MQQQIVKTKHMISPENINFCRAKTQLMQSRRERAIDAIDFNHKPAAQKSRDKILWNGT